MDEASSSADGGIFISYRRVDTAYAAGWLYDRLARRFGADTVFKDVDSIELGDDFVEVITAAVGSCDVLLALIGNQWLHVTGDDGRRRLDDPDDFVRLEIEAALARGTRVIPVLVDGAEMPEAGDVPESLALLPRRQGLVLDPGRFDADVGRLLTVLERALHETSVHRAIQAAAAPPTRMTMWTERDPERRSNPTIDEMRQAVSDLSLPEGGNSFLVVQREHPERYAQVARTGLDEYRVEYRGGDPARHFVIEPLSLATAQGAVCGWAINQPGWRLRYPWARLRTETTRPGVRSASGSTRRRDRDGRWIPTSGSERRDTAIRAAEQPAPAHAAPSRPAMRSAGRHRRRRARGNLGVKLAMGTAAVVAVAVAVNELRKPDKPRVVLAETFADDRHGWESNHGRYQDGAYRIELDTDDDSAWAYPASADVVSPVVPQRVRVEVRARSLIPLTDRSGFGILCNYDPETRSGYPLGVDIDDASIDKIGSGSYDQLDAESLPASAHQGVDVLVAECTTDTTEGVVELRLQLNGVEVARAVDTTNPWLSGTVGIHASSLDRAGLLTEFDDFRVEVTDT